MKLKEVIGYMEEWAPLDLQEDWDNSGLQVGDKEDDITGVLVALDPSLEALDYCKAQGFNLMINHHPLIFSPLTNLDRTDHIARIIAQAIREGINIYAVHTNLDAAQGGVNDVLADCLGYDLPSILAESQPGYGIGRYGTITETSLGELAQRTSYRLQTNLTYYGDPQAKIRLLAISGGSGGSMIKRAVDLGMDALITGDISHHDYLDALAQGLNIIDAGHYGTEQPVCYKVKDYLQNKGLTRVEVFEKKDPIQVIQVD